MAQDIVSGLFGLSPYEAQMKERQFDQESAMNLAQMGPQVLANYAAASAGQAFGGMLAESQGRVSPEVAQAQARQQALQGLDLSSSQSILAKAQQVQDPQLKMKLMLVGQQKAKEEREASLNEFKIRDEALFRRTEREQQRADKLQIEKDKIEQRDREIAKDLQIAKQRGEDTLALERERIAGRQALAQIAAAMKQSAQDSKVKPDLPTPALKLQQEELDAIGTASLINKDLNKYQAMIDDKQLDLGLISNLAARGKNILGASDPQSVAFANFKADMEKLRNDSLRLNKGTQTEGDAVRAWNELFENMSDPKVVKSRLKTIQEKNAAATEFRKKNVNAIRRNFKADQFDFSEYETPAVAKSPQESSGKIGGGGWAIRPK